MRDSCSSHQLARPLRRAPSSRTKLTAEQVAAIRVIAAHGSGISQAWIARLYGVTQPTVSRIVNLRARVTSDHA